MAKNKPFSILDEVTAVAESGNRNYDDRGRPVTSPKGARFAMQVMPETARDPGFGLKPADPNNAEDMNRLGREYRAAMEARYKGDLGKMWAAYNAGPGAVDAAIATHGEAWLSKMPQETKDYVRKNMGNVSGAGGGYNATQSGHGVADPAKFLEGLASSLGPEAKASQNVTQNSEAIFGSDAELKARGKKVEESLDRQGQQIDILDQVTQVAQQGAMEAMTRQIEGTRAISDEIVQGTNELKAKVKPVFEARGRIADQLDKVNSMNPLERGLRGIFDLNYDKEYLGEQLNNYESTLKARAYDYEYLNTLHAAGMKEMERRYAMDTALPSLMVDQAKEDLGLAGMRLQQTSAMLGSLKDQIGTESQLIAAKAGARQDLLGQLDTPTLTDLMNQAQTAGGMVQFNGIDVSYKELRDRIQVNEHQTLETEAYRMSIASGRMDIAEKYAGNLARSLTRGQLEAAAANGWVHNGVQIPTDLGTGLLQNQIQADRVKADTIANSMPANTALQIATSYREQGIAIYNRGKELFGYDGMKGSQPYLAQSEDLTRRLVQATQNNEPPEVIAALTQQIQANAEKYNKFVDDRMVTQLGGDKRAAGYMKAFMYGSQISAGTAAEAMTYFAIKGSLPQGMNISPEAKQVFMEAQKLAKAAREGGWETDSQGRRRKIEPIKKEADLIQYVQSQLVGKASSIMGRARESQIMSQMPIVARQAGHSFGQMKPEVWAKVKGGASWTAANQISSGLSFSGLTRKPDPNEIPRLVQTMMETGKPVEDSEAGRQLLKSVQEKASLYKGFELDSIVKQLDSFQQLKPGVANSSLLMDFMQSNKFAVGITGYSAGRGSQSMAEYLVNPLVKGAAETRLGDTLKNLGEAAARRDSHLTRLAQNPETAKLLQPRARTSMILRSIPEIGAEGSQGLAPFVDKFFDSYTRDTGFPGIESPNAKFMREDAALFSALQAAKFENPRMEAWRKAAVKGWKDHSTAQQGFVSRMIESVFGDQPDIRNAERSN